MDMTDIHRVAIVGAPGSGKSTLARQLGHRLSLPVFRMDHIHWKPAWEERASDEKSAMARHVLAQEKWIFEGGFSKIQSERLERAQVMIWLDLPLGIRAWRIARRTIRWFGRVRPDMQERCREGLNPEMFKFFRYIWRTRHSAREKIALSLQLKPEHLHLVHLRSTRDVRRYLEQI
jgi:adenylate kinase family enzyme